MFLGVWFTLIALEERIFDGAGEKIDVLVLLKVHSLVHQRNIHEAQSN